MLSINYRVKSIGKRVFPIFTRTLCFYKDSSLPQDTIKLSTSVLSISCFNMTVPFAEGQLHKKCLPQELETVGTREIKNKRAPAVCGGTPVHRKPWDAFKSYSGVKDKVSCENVFLVTLRWQNEKYLAKNVVLNIQISEN